MRTDVLLASKTKRDFIELFIGDNRILNRRKCVFSECRLTDQIL